jgi:hypothetical protein
VRTYIAVHADLSEHSNVTWGIWLSGNSLIW